MRLPAIRSLALLALPPLALVLLDVALRWSLLTTFEPEQRRAYAIAALGSVLLWTDLLRAAAAESQRWWRRLAFAALVIGVWSTQLYAYGRYRALLTPEVLLSGTQFFPNWLSALRHDFAHAGLALGGAAAAGVLGPFYASRVRKRPRQAAAPDLACLLLVAAAILAPSRFGFQGAPADVLAVSALGQLGKARWVGDDTVRRAHPEARLPAAPPHVFTPAGAAQRNVIFILTESVRATSACADPQAPCKWMPFSHGIAAQRIPLLQLRALDSTTAISLLVLLTGQPPNAPVELTRRPPSLFEYAHAAGYQTAYVTSQNVLFGNMGTWLSNMAMDKRVYASSLETAPSLDTGADDEAAAQRMTKELAQMHEPYLAMLHFSNTHYPYEIDSDPPYTPQNCNGSREDPEPIHNRYHDAIYRQDRALAGFLQRLQAAPAFAHTVVLYTSDHGEQLGDHGYFGHTNTLYEEEIHVPGWLLAGDQALAPRERQQLTAKRNAHVTHLDVLPTLLDLLGAVPIEHSASAASDGAERSRGWSLQGRSWLRALPATAQLVPLANCTPLTACVQRNAGAMQGPWKLHAHQWTGEWRCFNTDTDPEEQHVLPLPFCSELLDAANAVGKPF